MIVDSDPTHKSKLVRSFLERTEGQVRLFVIPSHASDLDPDEQVWVHGQRDLVKRGIENRAQLEHRAISAVRRPQEIRELVLSVCGPPIHHLVSLRSKRLVKRSGIALRALL